MIIIINDDEHYLRWIEENPDGLVVNTTNPPSPGYLMLHRSTCRDISTSTRSNWTTKDYLKVCSNDLGELDKWARRIVGGELSACQRCHSNSSR